MEESSIRNQNPDVTIVGGGLAGIAAAVGLLGKGYDVTIVESNDRLGGRARSWRDEKTGDPVHIGPHIVMSEYPNFFKLLDRLGSRDTVVWQEDLFVTIMEGQTKYEKRQSNWLPAPFTYVPSEMKDDSYGRRDALSNLPVMLYALQMDDEDAMKLDNFNAYGFLRAMGVSDRFINSVWRFSCQAIMNMPLEYCSAGALMKFYRSFIGYNDYKIGFPKEGLGEMFAPQAEDYIENHENGELLMEREVTELMADGDRIDGVRLGDGTAIESDRTVIALTVPQLQKLLPRDWRRNYSYFSELGYFEPCRYISPYIWFDRKITDMMFWARRYDYADLNCDFYDLSNIAPSVEDERSLITSNIIYSDRVPELSDEEIVEETVYELSESFPEVEDAQVTHSVVNRIPLAIHAPYPGTQQRRPPADSPIEGLYLAGDWIDTGLPSSMEGAAKSGWMTAESILSKDDRSATLVEAPREIEGLAKTIDRIGQWGPLRSVRKLIPPF